MQQRIQHLAAILLLILVCAWPVHAAVVSDEILASQLFSETEVESWGVEFDVTALQDQSVTITGFYIYLPQNVYGSRDYTIQVGSGGGWSTLFDGSISGSGMQALQLSSSYALSTAQNHIFRISAEYQDMTPLFPDDYDDLPSTAYIDPASGTFGDAYIEISRGTVYGDHSFLSSSILATNVFWYGGIQYEYETVPLPASVLLLGGGLMALFGWRRRGR